ncbi:UNKNOWN [Stylonychia lemnae]|uniref:Uncharacterized protein n=1 Tax=Stylonychia lemnae TaxID=5949 RepID=A0A078A9X8_STYLE|nr:UNKNOWN [Stylonychia lemnae]|eukprot:CDW78701.1 UNKNOWN [Stylonychia lemnae]
MEYNRISESLYRLVFKQGDGLNAIMIVYAWKNDNQSYLGDGNGEQEAICLSNQEHLLKLYVYEVPSQLGDIQGYTATKLLLKMMQDGEIISGMTSPYCTDLSQKLIDIFGFSQAEGQIGFHVQYSLLTNEYSVVRLSFKSDHEIPTKIKSHFSRNFGYDYYVFGYDLEISNQYTNFMPQIFSQKDKTCKRITENKMQPIYYIKKGKEKSQQIVFPANTFESYFDKISCQFEIQYHIMQDQNQKPALNISQVIKYNETHYYFTIFETLNESYTVNDLTLKAINYDKYMFSDTKFQVILQCDNSNQEWKQTQFQFECTQGDNEFLILSEEIYSYQNTSDCFLTQELQQGFKSDIFIFDPEYHQLRVICSASDYNIGQQKAQLNIKDELGIVIQQITIIINIKKKEQQQSQIY